MKSDLVGRRSIRETDTRAFSFRGFIDSYRTALAFTIIGFELAVLKAPALSAEINKMSYQYSSDMAVLMPADDTFVLCDCKPAAPLFVKPQEVPIAVRAEEPFHFSLPPALQEESLPKNHKIVAIENMDTVKLLDPAEPGHPSLSVNPTIIQFGFNQVNLTPIQETEILKVVEQVKKTGGGVRIQGHTCDLGGSDQNNRVSFDRAERVATIFKEQGIDVADVEGKGSCCPLSTDRRLNRRVEIVVIKNGGDHEK